MRGCATAPAVRLLVFGAALMWAAPTTAAEPPAALLGPPSGDWRFEVLELRGGRIYRGVMRSETETSVLFLHVERPAGAPMYAVGLRVDRDNIARLSRLESQERAELERRLAGVLQRARIEARDAAGLALSKGQWHEQPSLDYGGEQFTLTSTADELTTRRAAVRLEQYFTAFAQFLPAPTGAAPLQIYLHGTPEEYRRHLAERQLELDHAAVYLAEPREIIAAADLSRFAAQLAATAAEHDRVREQYEAMLAALPERLREESKRLRAQGAQGAQLRELNLAARRRLEDEADRVRRTADEYDRRNAELFAEVTSGLFATLGHEVLHAQLDRARDEQGRPLALPRWLNEGLAQLFETAQLDAGQLRIDAPDARRLAAMQAELATAAGLPLEDLLAADERLFLVAHRGEGVSERHYLYSWGLAYYLTVERGLVSPAWLAEYAAETAGGAPAVTAFERLVGQPLVEFQRDWRAAMLALASPTKAQPAPQTQPR